MVVPTATVEAARAACVALAGSGGSNMFNVPLSPTGEMPATHWISAGLIEQEFADLLANPAPLGPEIAAIVAQADVSEEPWQVAVERLGLQVCAQEL